MPFRTDRRRTVLNTAPLPAEKTATVTRAPWMTERTIHAVTDDNVNGADRKPCEICHDEVRAKRQCVCRFDGMDDGFPF